MFRCSLMLWPTAYGTHCVPRLSSREEGWTEQRWLDHNIITYHTKKNARVRVGPGFCPMMILWTCAAVLDDARAGPCPYPAWRCVRGCGAPSSSSPLLLIIRLGCGGLVLAPSENLSIHVYATDPFFLSHSECPASLLLPLMSCQVRQRQLDPI